MKTVADILHAKPRSILSVAPDATVYEALSLMARHEIGALIVLDHGRLVGMLSERDYARKVTLLGRSSRDLRVDEIMTTHVRTVHLDNTIEDCMALMTDKRIRHLPVLGDSTVVGLVSIGDVVKALLEEQQFTIRQLERYITA